MYTDCEGRECGREVIQLCSGPITYRTKCLHLQADDAPRDVYVSSEQVQLTKRTGSRESFPLATVGRSARADPLLSDPARSRDDTGHIYRRRRRFKCAVRTVMQRDKIGEVRSLGGALEILSSPERRSPLYE